MVNGLLSFGYVQDKFFLNIRVNPPPSRIGGIMEDWFASIRGHKSLTMEHGDRAKKRIQNPNERIQICYFSGKIYENYN